MGAVRELMSGKPVAYYPELARAMGGISAALFLQQVAHWQGGKDRWVFRTQEEFERELAMSPKVQASARKHLVQLEALEEKYDGLPRRLYYRVNWEIVEGLIKNCQTEIQESPDGEDLHPPNGDTSSSQTSDLQYESSEENREENKEPSPRGQKPAETEFQKHDPPAKQMTTLTVDRCREVGLEPSPGQIANWGKGWSGYVYVPEGQEPPPLEQQHAVLGEIVAAAAGRLGRTRFFLGVDDALKRVRGEPRNGALANGHSPPTNPGEYERTPSKPLRRVTDEEAGLV